MSQLEVVKNVIYSYPFVLITGKVAPAVIANFGGASKLLSIVRSVAAGTVGVPAAAVAVPTGTGAAATYKLGIYSSDAGDTSTYIVYWTNQYIQSPLYITGTNTTLGAGVQYLP